MVTLNLFRANTLIAILPATIACIILLALMPQFASAQLSDQERVQQMYIAYYGRPGDPAGIDYWAARIAAEGGAWTADIVNAFGESAEYTNRFGNLSEQDLIANLFNQLFNRAVDDAGMAFYLDLLDGTNQSGANPGDPPRRSTLAQIALDIANGAQNDDRDILTNKVEVASYFTDRLRSTGAVYQQHNIFEAMEILDIVDVTNESMDLGISAVKAYMHDPEPLPAIKMVSGLAADRSDSDRLYAVGYDPANPTLIYTLDASQIPAVITGETQVLSAGATTSYALEGLVQRVSGGFWAVSGIDSFEPTRLLEIAQDGSVLQEILLEASIRLAAEQVGFAGVAVTGGGSAEAVFVALRHELDIESYPPLEPEPPLETEPPPLEPDPRGYARIARYIPSSQEWSYFFYPLDNSAEISELALLDAQHGTLAVLERDDESGPRSRIKRVYQISVSDISEQQGLELEHPVLEKQLLYDLAPELSVRSGSASEQVDGLAYGVDGDAYLGYVDTSNSSFMLRLFAQRQNGQPVVRRGDEMAAAVEDTIRIVRGDLYVFTSPSVHRESIWGCGDDQWDIAKQWGDPTDLCYFGSLKNRTYSMRLRVDAGEGVRNNSVFIEHVGAGSQHDEWMYALADQPYDLGLPTPVGVQTCELKDPPRARGGFSIFGDCPLFTEADESWMETKNLYLMIRPAGPDASKCGAELTCRAYVRAWSPL
ncbi:MAG: DUF4214 domain-containing protein [Gammaproteobacteria bacterium]|jgi:hypothetical protein|nr:DUF4214 domain-containing protein [Gammaproteobacteria bacterium]